MSEQNSIVEERAEPYTPAFTVVRIFHLEGISVRKINKNKEISINLFFHHYGKKQRNNN